MKNRMLKSVFYNLFALTMVLFISAAATASGDGYALVVQSSPPGAGAVTPETGVHKISVGQTVTLSATPKQGYRFLYWLGDVSSTSALDTTVSIDSPKLVVAVFTREGFDDGLPGAGVTDGMHAPGGGRFYNPIQSPASVNPPTPFFGGSRGRFIPQLPDDPIDDIPVPGDDDDIPGDDDDIPVPGDNEVPEPSTVLLLGLGSGILLKRRKK